MKFVAVNAFIYNGVKVYGGSILELNPIQAESLGASVAPLVVESKKILREDDPVATAVQDVEEPPVISEAVLPVVPEPDDDEDADIVDGPEDDDEDDEDDDDFEDPGDDDLEEEDD